MVSPHKTNKIEWKLMFSHSYEDLLGSHGLKPISSFRTSWISTIDAAKSICWQLNWTSVMELLQISSWIAVVLV